MNITKSTQVTRIDNSAIQRGVRRIALPFIGGILALSLAACETKSNSSSSGLIGSLLGSDDQQTASTASQGPNKQLAQVKPLTFAPIIGAPAKISSKMSERLIASARAQNLKVESSNTSGYTVRGYLVAAAATTGTKLSYIWDIRDQNGQRAQRFQGDELIEGKKGGDPWALVDDTAIERIAASTADKISTWMYGAINSPVANANKPPAQQQTASIKTNAPAPANTPQRQQPNPPQTSVSVATAAQTSGPAEIIAVVPPVTGAPGDGQQSLTTAMKRHLQNAGVKLTEGNTSSAYTVRGTVELGSADGGQQPITIRWLVVDPNGKQIDKAVVQRNKIPAGSLNGPWGKVADLAASEAAKSVAKLIRPTG